MAFQQVGGLSAFGDERQQQVFDRSVFVIERSGEIHGPLNDTRAFLREELFACALDSRQRRHGSLHVVAQLLHVDARASPEERSERIVFAHEHAQQVEWLDGLLSVFFRQQEGRLERLLGFYGECVDVHIVVFFGSVSVEALRKALATPSEPAILTGFVRTLAASS